MFPNVLSVFSLVALFVHSVVANDCTRSYTVKDGDYCDKISRENNVSTFQLAALNAGKYNSACTDLAIGSVLCLAGSPSEDCQTVHTVELGDTCDAISAAAGTNNTILYHNNPQIDANCFNIYVGEVLCTAKTVQAPSTPSSGVGVPVTGPPASGGNNNNPPTTTPTSVITVPPNSTPTPAYNGGGDDDNLPFCDEI